jgi:small subunit ribosomal protein S17
MPKKKNEEIEGAGTEEMVETPAEETAVEAAADEAPAVEETPAEETAVEAAPETEAAPAEEEPAAEVEAALAEETPAEVEVAPVVDAKPKKAAAPKAPKAAKTIEKAEGAEDKKVHKRAERIGIVASDKMTKTVTVRVDRLVKHPVYRKYVKKRKKFMAHDELGAKTGDKVRIQETRPLSARKRWRVVEILHRAEL